MRYASQLWMCGSWGLYANSPYCKLQVFFWWFGQTSPPPWPLSPCLLSPPSDAILNKVYVSIDFINPTRPGAKEICLITIRDTASTVREATIMYFSQAYLTPGLAVMPVVSSSITIAYELLCLFLTLTKTFTVYKGRRRIGLKTSAASLLLENGKVFPMK